MLKENYFQNLIRFGLNCTFQTDSNQIHHHQMKSKTRLKTGRRDDRKRDDQCNELGAGQSLLLASVGHPALSLQLRAGQRYPSGTIPARRPSTSADRSLEFRSSHAGKTDGRCMHLAQVPIPDWHALNMIRKSTSPYRTQPC